MAIPNFLQNKTTGKKRGNGNKPTKKGRELRGQRRRRENNREGGSYGKFLDELERPKDHRTFK